MIKMFRHYRPFVGIILVTVALIGIQSFAELLLPALMQNIIDVSIVNKDYRDVILRAAVMLLEVIAEFAAVVGIGYFSAKISAGISRDLRRKVFDKAEQFSLQEFDRFGTSSMITRTTNDITQIQNFTVMFLRIVVMAPIMCIGGLVMAFATDSALAVYVLMAMPLVVLAIAFVAKK